jgi:hypothetical protein
MNPKHQDRQKADAELPVVLTTSGQIDQLLHDISCDDRTNSIWAKVKTELGQLADAYGVQVPSHKGSSV